MAEMRLQRFLAQAGLASRRKAEEMILAGRITVNGKVVRTLGTKVNPSKDRVVYEGQRIIAEEHVWLLLNKPTKCVSTADDPEGRETVLDLVGPQGVRLYPVGRLDYHTEGVLLLTNDGDLANALMHPKNQIQRVYQVKVKGLVTPDLLDRLREGVILDTGETAKAQVAIIGSTGKHTWLEMILREGRNRQIHRMLDSVALTVLKLIRVAYGELTAEGLKPGRYRSLTQSEVNKLRALGKLKGETRRSKAKPPGRRNRQAPSKDKPGRSERAERSERSGRSERPERPERPGRPEGKRKPTPWRPGAPKPKPTPRRPEGQKPRPRRPDAQKPAPRRPDEQKPEPQRSDSRKPAPQRPGRKPPAPQRPGPKKPAPQRPGPKKPGPKKPGPRKPAPPRPGPKKPTSRKPGPRKPGPKKR